MQSTKIVKDTLKFPEHLTLLNLEFYNSSYVKNTEAEKLYTAVYMAVSESSAIGRFNTLSSKLHHKL